MGEFSSSKRHRRISRRSFLGLSGMGATALALGTAGFSEKGAWARPRFLNDPFSLGVASGDPLPDGVVLWTRLASEPLAEDGHGGMPDRRVPVRWELAEDEGFRRVVWRGTEIAVPELGHSVHAEVSGLRPGREYYYRFRVGPEESPVGRTKTAPAAGAPLAALSFAFASCQRWTDGFYAAYRGMAGEDLDLVVHLGDYIYEYGIGAKGGSRNQPVPSHLGGEALDLGRYRLQYALYKSDPDLQAAHAAFPWVVTMDDHEVENDWADETPEASSQTPGTEEFLRRRAAAFQAYYENLPLRRSSMPQGPDMPLYRRLTFGDLAEFNVLDTRQYRDKPISCRGQEEELVDGYCDSVTDSDRTIVGDEQERWLLEGLGRSRARWNVLAQQIVFSHNYNYGTESNPDHVSGGHNWSGYKADRDAIVDFLARSGTSNPTVITGDIHQNRAYDLKSDISDPDSPTMGAEFVGSSITSGGDIEPNTRYENRRDPYLKFQNNNRGYVRCQVTPGLWRADYRIVSSVRDPNAPVSTVETFVTEDGNPGAQRA